jgi:hypothetical protein
MDDPDQDEAETHTAAGAAVNGRRLDGKPKSPDCIGWEPAGEDPASTWAGPPRGTRRADSSTRHNANLSTAGPNRDGVFC